MKRGIVIVSSCLLLAACTSGGTKTITGSGTPSSSHGAAPTLPASAQGWHRDSGIVDGGPVVSHDRVCQNSYGNPYRGGWIFICAGGKQSLDSSGNWVYVQGAIWVSVSPDARQSGPDNQLPASGPTNEYVAPNSPTWVKLVSVNGAIVNLQRQDGSALTFSLQTNQFS